MELAAVAGDRAARVRTACLRRHCGCLVLAIAALLAGCASSGRQQATRAVTGMSTLRDELASGRDQIDRTIGAANAIRQATSGDLRRPFDGYARELRRLESAASTVRSRADDMTRRADAYHHAWQTQLDALTSPTLRLRSADLQRRSRQRFDAIRTELTATGAAYDMLVSDLTDIRDFLEFNLTQQSVRSIGDVFVRASHDARVVQQSLDAVIAELDRASSAISSDAG